MKSTEVFKVGNLNIGYVDSKFESRVGGEVEEKELGSFKFLGHYMENAQAIEDKLKPGKCTLGDVYAFLKNPPEGTKDGLFNLFLVGNYVVSVHWGSFRGDWRVHTWAREAAWDSAARVFSPGRILGSLDTSTPENVTEPSSLELELKNICYQLKRIADHYEKETTNRSRKVGTSYKRKTGTRSKGRNGSRVRTSK